MTSPPSGPTGRADLLVRAEGLVVGYDLPVAAPASFSVRGGEVLAVVGPNGSGKSTLLRTVLGLLEPVEGVVEVLGTPVDERTRRFRASVARDLGEDAFLPSLTCREHLLLVAAGHGDDDPDELADALLEEFGLVARADATPSALSSGQRRRLLLAAVLARPRLLSVLDEPEQRLDAAMRRTVARRLAAERLAGRAVLVATHDPQLLRSCATSALVLGDEVSEVVDADVAADRLERDLA